MHACIRLILLLCPCLRSRSSFREVLQKGSDRRGTPAHPAWVVRQHSMTPAHRWSAAKLVPKDSVRCAAAWDYRSAPSSPSRVSHPLFGELRGRITLEASYGIEPSPPAASIAARPRTAPPRLQASAALMLSPTEYQQRRRPVSAATADKVLATRREVQRARVSPSTTGWLQPT